MHRLLWNSAFCAQGYPQKMWNVNSRAILIRKAELSGIPRFRSDSCGGRIDLAVLMLAGWMFADGLGRCERSRFPGVEREAD